MKNIKFIAISIFILLTTPDIWGSGFTTYDVNVVNEEKPKVKYYIIDHSNLNPYYDISNRYKAFQNFTSVASLNWDKMTLCRIYFGSCSEGEGSQNRCFQYHYKTGKFKVFCKWRKSFEDKVVQKVLWESLKVLFTKYLPPILLNHMKGGFLEVHSSVQDPWILEKMRSLDITKSGIRIWGKIHKPVLKGEAHQTSKKAPCTINVKIVDKKLYNLTRAPYRGDIKWT